MDTMLSRALREFTTGPLNQLLVNLGGQDGSQWEEEFKKFLRKEPCWSDNQAVAQAVIPEPSLPILKFICKVTIPATTSRFVAKEKFVINKREDALVRISGLGKVFVSCFLDGEGKIEDLLDEQTLCCYGLQRSSKDLPIVHELGGVERSETTLSELFSLLEKQGKGTEGVLLNRTDSNNIFFVRVKEDLFRGVGVRWKTDGWYIGAGEIESSGSHDARSRVFSHHQSFEPKRAVEPTTFPASVA
ncbi:MAG: hypothetical protein WC666_02590 [Candidatus Paceibacterota bacterium]|jgi:hypothetical protein